MWCDKFKCILSTDACIRRQTINWLKEYYKDYEDSLQTCKECRQGKAVILNPENFINSDYKKLIQEHLRTIKTKKLELKRRTLKTILTLLKEKAK